jgi:D-alanyl-D-alanine-carboxypeptidase/D-alanyl-D-alanine-endopeptidase
LNHVFRSLSRSLWVKTLTAALLTLSLMTSTLHAAEPNEIAPPQAEQLTTETAAAFLEQFFTSEAAKPHYVGASIVVVKDGQVVAQDGFGFANKEKQEAIDPAQTVFRIASVSKTFTAAAIMQLAQQGKLDLKADFRTYIDALEFDNTFSTPVTIEHLLTHTTGFEIRDPQQEDIHTDFERVVEIEDYVRKHMPPVIREPGSSYMYDNFGSLLLGLIVQNVSGERYEAYMEKHVFEPLGMNNSGFLLKDALKDQLAVGYDAVNEPLALYTVTPTVMPHGGMLSTAEDIGKFMISFLDNKAGKKQILSKDSVELMTTYRSSIHPLLPDTTYGFEAAPQLPGAGSSSKIITKAGDLNGFSSLLLFIPEQNTGVFLTYNKMGILRNLFYSQFINHFFPQYAAAAALEEFEPQSAEELAKFSGYYADLRLRPFVSRLSHEEEAGTLTISDAFIGPRQLRQVDVNLFVDSLSNQFTAFKLDENGKAIYMKEPYINPLGYAGIGAEPVGYADVDTNHPYAQSIMALQSLGYYPNDASSSFNPEQAVTRGEYIQRMLVTSSIKGSLTKEYAFTDIEGHPSAPFIQMAYELGMVVGDGTGGFGPDRAVTRQESAVMLWRLLSAQYPQEIFDPIILEGTTDEWAVPAVKMMIALGLHGPEVQPASNGPVDFHSLQTMNRQEEAALLYALFTQPTNQIVAKLTAEQNAQTAPEVEPEVSK